MNLFPGSPFDKPARSSRRWFAFQLPLDLLLEKAEKISETRFVVLQHSPTPLFGGHPVPEIVDFLVNPPYHSVKCRAGQQSSCCPDL